MGAPRTAWVPSVVTIISNLKQAIYSKVCLALSFDATCSNSVTQTSPRSSLAARLLEMIIIGNCCSVEGRDHSSLGSRHSF